ncbi:methyltransferase domain-containing protein [Pendulispora rubella]|uniref:Methyltransferase domain-containing protein n=1 Tax=Pendulispora rubella TaxID=2741070 RepID=A0ABZ2LKP2_9BACT
MNDELPPSIKAAAGTGASASEALGDGIEVALEDDSLPTPIAPPVRAAASGARAKLRDVDEDAPASRRVRPRMTLRIPDDEVARPLSAPPPEPSPPSKPEIAPPRLEPPPPPPPRRTLETDSQRPPPPVVPRSEIPPAPTSVPRVEIAPQRIITINAPQRADLLAGVVPSGRIIARDGRPPSSTPPDTEPLPSSEIAAELTLDDEVEPIAEDFAPTPRDASAIASLPTISLGGAPESARRGPPSSVPSPPPPPSPPLPVIVMDEPPRAMRGNMVTIPDSDGAVDIPVVEDEEFARPSAPELLPDDLVSVESEPSMERARPRIPPPAPPVPPPGSNPAPTMTPIVSLDPPMVDSGRSAPTGALAPPVPPSSGPVAPPASPPVPATTVKPSHPPPSGNSPPPVPVIPNRGMSSTPDLDERGIASVPFVIGPAQSELAPPPLNDASVLQRKRSRPWWEELFNDDFIRTMAKLTDAQIAAEADFIEDSLAVAKGAMVLDLACGTGRHAIELTRRGYQVVGYDLSLSMLARAADEAQDRNQKLNFVQGDMREMTFEETFDGIYSWNTSFGYFDEDRNAQVISRVHRALRKGGQFLLDVVNRDFIGRQAPSLAWFEGEGCVCMDEMTIDWITSRMRIKRTMMMDDGRSKEIEYSIRIYSLHELGKMLHDHGFRVAEVSGRIATPGVFFGTDSPRTLILAEKRG